ncbi:MAG: hypothetical protein RBS68_12120 [Anaerolineales bacterium]|nr:hypothetical protein [Anaerolineales bacterium]
MTLDEAILEIQSKISSASASAQIKIVKISDEEARITVLARAQAIQPIKDATFMACMDLLNEGFDIQVQVYDQDAPPLQG